MAIAEPFTVTYKARSSVLSRIGKRLGHISLGDRISLSLLVAMTLVAIAAPILSPYDPLAPVAQPFLAPFHSGSILGSDPVGRDQLSRILYGIRISWFSALIVIASGVIIGGTIGLIAGARGGWIDAFLMRITDGFLALPGPVLAIAVVSSLGPGLRNTLIAVAIVWWPFYARIVRGEVKALAARPHLEAAKLAGVKPLRRALRHLLPGVIPAVIVTASLDVGNLVLTLAGLSFLGLGAPQPTPELGAMASQNLQYLLQEWWVPVMPAIALMIMALIGNVAGDALRSLVEERR